MKEFIEEKIRLLKLEEEDCLDIISAQVTADICPKQMEATYVCIQKERFLLESLIKEFTAS